MKKILAISLAIFALSAGAILPFATPVLADSMNGDDEVYLMVGDANRDYSGDFILVESNGKYGLIDAGTGNQELERQQAIYDFFDKKGITTFEFVILTHAHVDHISALTTVYGTETFSLFDKYQVKELILKDYPDISDIPQTSAGELAEHNGRRRNAYNDAVARARASGAQVGFKDSLTLGDFKVSVVNNYPLSAAEKSARDFNLNYDSLGVLVEKDGYNMFLAGDIESFDFEQTVNDLRSLGVTKLDAFKLNHHGYSVNVNDPQTFRMMTDFNGDVPAIVGITNSTARLLSDPAPVSTRKLAMLESTMTNGLYWYGDGIINFNFSNLSENGLAVSQVGNTLMSSVKHVNGNQVFAQTQLATAPTKEDFIADKMRAPQPTIPQTPAPTPAPAPVLAEEQKASVTANQQAAKIEAPNTGFEQNGFVLLAGLGTVIVTLFLVFTKKLAVSKIEM